MSNSISIPYSPIEAALGLRHLPGLVFFDSAQVRGEQLSIVAANPYEIVRNNWEQLSTAVSQLDGKGIAAGFFDYDGDFHFGLYNQLLVFNHRQQSWTQIGQLSKSIKPGNRCGPLRQPVFKPMLGAPEFCSMVERARQYIAAGDIYQVNLSQKFEAAWDGDPFTFYKALRSCSPAPYAAYMELGGRCILSSSPESFLEMRGRQISTRPIKGTSPRHPDDKADQQSALDLLASPKETAELVMITDLERNDLGQVCEYGSVHVKELLKLESYEQVYHLVSHITGRLRPGITHVQALRACFPGGSITGAPKKRAREIIAELEPVARGLYTGALGYFGCNGESQFNIAIRTVVIEGGRAHFHVGAGIVADSVAEREYEETLHKAAGILLAAKRMGSEQPEQPARQTA